MRLPILGPDYELRSRVAQTRILENLYLEENPGDDEHPYIAIATPGLKLIKDTAGGAVRGLHEHKGVMYGVYDATFFRLNGQMLTTLGTLGSSTGRVRFTAIETAVFMIDDSGGYVYYPNTNTFTAISDVDFPTLPSTVTSQDGYIIVNSFVSGDESKFFISGLDDPETWAALDYATAVSKPDNLTAVVNHRGYLWLLGEYSTEIYFNSGNVDFPFEPQSGAVLEYGCAARDTVSTIGNQLFWLGQNKTGDPVVLSETAFQPAIISTRALNKEISKYSTVADAYSWAYQQDGHEFYVLTFPSEERTWVYDLTTQVWHRRTYYNSVTGIYEHCLAFGHAYKDGTHFIASRLDGKIYKLCPDVYDDGGVHIRRKLQTTLIETDTRRLSIFNVHVRVDPGQGLVAGQGSDPLLALRISKDHGNTYSGKTYRQVGKQGEYNKRAMWTRLGSARSFVLEFTYTEPTPFSLLDARADIEVGSL